MAKFKEILTANTSIPTAIENKFPILPKLSTQMAKVAGQVPDGPELPAMAVKVLEPPPPNGTGQPLAGFFNGPPIGPSSPAPAPAAGNGGATQTSAARGDEIARRGTLQLGPRTIAQRGTLN